MHHSFAKRFLSVLVLTSVLSAPAFAAETYKFDPNHTAVTWHVTHFGFSTPSGKFMNVDGTLVLDEANPVESKVNVTIPVSGLDTGLSKFDEHLKSKEFLDATTYPTATFVSDKIELEGEDSATVHGTLTLHGVTKPVDLNVRLNKIGNNMMNKKTAGFTATTMFKRSDFGMTTFIPNIGDDVVIDIEAEANIEG